MSIGSLFPDFARRAVDTAASTAALIASEMSAEDPENANGLEKEPHLWGNFDQMLLFLISP